MKYFLFPLIVRGLLAACNADAEHEKMSKRRRAHEAEGRVLLEEARRALEREQFADARGAIRTLRDSFPLALSARTAAILLDDSISLAEARRQLGAVPTDSAERLKELALKVKFYTRKLEHDKKVAAEDVRKQP